MNRTHSRQLNAFLGDGGSCVPTFPQTLSFSQEWSAGGLSIRDSIVLKPEKRPGAPSLPGTASVGWCSSLASQGARTINRSLSRPCRT